MESGVVDISVPEGFEETVSTTPEELEDQVRLMAALKMFELGKLSSGHAAQLAGRTRAEFLEACGRYRISVFNYPAEEAADELQRDLDTLRTLSDPE
jgi:predicted HTH domain antitoxin